MVDYKETGVQAVCHQLVFGASDAGWSSRRRSREPQGD